MRRKRKRKKKVRWWWEEIYHNKRKTWKSAVCEDWQWWLIKKTKKQKTFFTVHHMIRILWAVMAFFGFFSGKNIYSNHHYYRTKISVSCLRREWWCGWVPLLFHYTVLGVAINANFLCQFLNHSRNGWLYVGHLRAFYRDCKAVICQFCGSWGTMCAFG